MAVAVDESRGKELAGHVLFAVVGSGGTRRADMIDRTVVDAEIRAAQRFIAALFLAQQDICICQQCSHKMSSYLHFISLCSLTRTPPDCNGQKN